MMKKLMRFMLVSTCLAVLFLSGCQNNGDSKKNTANNQNVENTIIDLTEQEATKLDFVALKSDNIKQDILEVSIEKEEKAEVDTFCVADGKLYYALNYRTYYENNEGQAEGIQFDANHNTQIRVYDMETRTDELVYKYNEDFCVMVTDLQCNGNYLVWEDYDVEQSGWCIKARNLQENVQSEIIFKESEAEGSLDTVTLVLEGDSLYWYDLVEKESIYSVLYRYDFNQDKIEMIKSEIDTCTPYTHASIFEDVITTYKYEDTFTKIFIDAKDDQIQVKTEGNIAEIQSNGNLCVWLKSVDERDMLYVYDIENEKFHVIPCGYIFSFAIYNDIVIVNQNNGIYAYNIIDKEYITIKETDSTYCGYMYSGTNNVYSIVNNLSNTEFQILIIQ